MFFLWSLIVRGHHKSNKASQSNIHNATAASHSPHSTFGPSDVPRSHVSLEPYINFPAGSRREPKKRNTQPRRPTHLLCSELKVDWCVSLFLPTLKSPMMMQTGLDQTSSRNAPSQATQTIVSIVEALMEKQRLKVEAECLGYTLKASFHPIAVINPQKAKSLRPGPDYVGRAVAYPNRSRGSSSSFDNKAALASNTTNPNNERRPPTTNQAKTLKAKTLSSVNQVVALKLLHGVRRDLESSYSSSSSVTSSSFSSLPPSTLHTPLPPSLPTCPPGQHPSSSGVVSLALVNSSGQLLVVTASHEATQKACGMQLCRGCGAFYSHPRASGLAAHQRSESAASACVEAGMEVIMVVVM